MSRRCGVRAVGLVLVALAGCGGGSDRASTTTTAVASSSSVRSTVPRSTTTSTQAAHPGTDLVLAKAALLKLADFPSGWTATPYIAGGDPSLDARIAACMHVDVALTNTDLQPHANSPYFAGPAGHRVQSGISIFPSPSLPTRWIQLYSAGAARACLATNLGASTRTALRVSSLSLPSVGDGQVGIRFTAGSSTLDAVFARRGRALAYLAVQTSNGVDEGALLAKMIGRLTPAG